MIAPSSNPKLEFRTAIWADREGRGFRVQENESTAATTPEQWREADRLRAQGFGQISEQIRSTTGIPIWTLQHVTIAGRGHWCFTAQGRDHGEIFGVAGGAFFGFLPDHHTPTQAWKTGIEAFAPGWQQPQVDSEKIKQCIAHVLKLLVDKPNIILAADNPVEAAVVIESVLGVVPPGVVQRWTWATCPTRWPETSRVVMIAGIPSTSFPDIRAIQHVTNRLTSAPQTTRQDQHLTEQHKEAYSHLVDRAAGGNSFPYESDHSSLITALEEVYHSLRRAPQWNEVPRILLSPDYSRLADHPGVVLEWATEDPKRVLTTMRDRKNPAQRITGILHEDERMDFVGRLVRGETKVDPIVHSSWLRTLGVTPDNVQGLFPELAQYLAKALDKNPPDLTPIQQWISPQQGVPLLLEVIRSLKTPSPTTAIALIKNLPTFAHGESLQEITKGIAKTLFKKIEPAKWENWLIAVLQGAQSQQVSQEVIHSFMYGALLEIQEYSKGQLLNSSKLQKECQKIGIDKYVPQELKTWLAPPAPRPDRTQTRPNQPAPPSQPSSTCHVQAIYRPEQQQRYDKPPLTPPTGNQNPPFRQSQESQDQSWLRSLSKKRFLSRDKIRYANIAVAAIIVIGFFAVALPLAFNNQASSTSSSPPSSTSPGSTPPATLPATPSAPLPLKPQELPLTLHKDSKGWSLSTNPQANTTDGKKASDIAQDIKVEINNLLAGKKPSIVLLISEGPDPGDIQEIIANLSGYRVVHIPGKGNAPKNTFRISVLIEG